MALVAIGNVVGKSMKKNGVKQQVAVALAIERAHTAMIMLLGEEILEVAKPLYIRQRTLTIASLQSAAATAIGRVREDLIAAVNQGMNPPLVERIRVIS